MNRCACIRFLVLGICCAALAAALHAADSTTTRPAEIDWNRARARLHREKRAARLTPAEQAYLGRARAERRAGRGPNAPPGPGGLPAITGKESTGLVPLDQLKPGEKYKGFDGGLYGNGRNQPPEAHAKAAVAEAAKVVPLDGEGRPAAEGKVVLLSIGMSNTTQEFSRFKQIADDDREKSPRLVIVDGAQGGKDAAAWTSGAAGRGENPVWEEADKRLKTAGVAPRQVQVVWVKQALIQQGRHGEFPEHAKVLQRELVSILNLAKSRYPNLRLAYLSSRIYGGYATTQLNPE